MKNVAAVVLAAGKSTRMKSSLSKVMHPIAGRPVVSYVLEAARAAGAKPVCVVSSKEQKELGDYLKGKSVKTVFQKEARGTADAVMSARRALKGFEGYVLILCGDVPLMRSEVLKEFVEHTRKHDATLGVVTMQLNEPGRYGRIVRDLDGHITRIVEAKDATGREQDIKEVNTGVFCVKKDWLFKSLNKVEPKNAQREYYVTDIVSMAIAEGREVVSTIAPLAYEFLGINTRVELAHAAEIIRERINKAHQLAGVGIVDFRHTYVDVGVSIGRDTEVWPNCFLLGKTKVGADCVIENGVVLKDAVVGDGVHIKSYSVIEESTVSAEATVGPFSRVRPQSRIGKKARLGNFVEVKKSEIREGAKANHLTYLGDATVGEGANIGCGTITCNYDGKHKHRTVIGSGAFIGSDTQFIAPVRVGKGATVGAGSTITDNVPPESLALARSKQVVVKNYRKKRKKG
jgi:bifunctional UDP-N-acetylglucosamine pyrophosphorylase/glucosamine-1-phosphate N-acetyltransferase